MFRNLFIVQYSPNVKSPIGLLGLCSILTTLGKLSINNHFPLLYRKPSIPLILHYLICYQLFSIIKR